MTTKDKILIFGVLIFVVIGTISYFYDKNVCDPKWIEIESKLNFIKSENSVVKIELSKETDDFQSNLVGTTVVITDHLEIETIRNLVNKRSTGTWNRPAAKWNVRMRLYLSNTENLDLEVSRIGNDKESKMTHIYFGSGRCNDNLPQTSLILGEHLERLTQYNGQPF